MATGAFLAMSSEVVTPQIETITYVLELRRWEPFVRWKIENKSILLKKQTKKQKNPKKDTKNEKNTNKQ